MLVPRPDTETLVDWALECLSQGPADPDVLDLGSGSGAIALALAHAWPKRACMPSKRARPRCAWRVPTACDSGITVQWLAGDWYSPLGERRFALIASNPPYVAEGDVHLHALRHEPQQALRAGVDGLDAIRCIVAKAPDHLLPGAWLLIEHAPSQADVVQDLLRKAGLVKVATRADLSGQRRCSGGQRRGDF